ncbi:hypothetical protein SF1_06430 [Sphingobacterium faecium NBRC 15299]|nr:hypothetical protein SF1_06430 [Sphingobacterium faecium NBRC 15299]
MFNIQVPLTAPFQSEALGPEDIAVDEELDVAPFGCILQAEKTNKLSIRVVIDKRTRFIFINFIVTYCIFAVNITTNHDGDIQKSYH